jgi:hypothetical protein
VQLKPDKTYLRLYDIARSALHSEYLYMFDSLLCYDDIYIYIYVYMVKTLIGISFLEVASWRGYDIYGEPFDIHYSTRGLKFRAQPWHGIDLFQLPLMEINTIHGVMITSRHLKSSASENSWPQFR